MLKLALSKAIVYSTAGATAADSGSNLNVAVRKEVYSHFLLRLAVVVTLGALTAACFQPLYGDQKISGDEFVRHRLSSVEIPEIKAANGTLDARLAVSVRNALLYDFVWRR